MRGTIGSFAFGLVVALLLFSPVLILVAGVGLVLAIVAAALDAKDWIKGEGAYYRGPTFTADEHRRIKWLEGKIERGEPFTPADASFIEQMERRVKGRDGSSVAGGGMRRPPRRRKGWFSNIGCVGGREYWYPGRDD